MAKKITKKRATNQATATKRPSEDEKIAVTREMLRPTVQAALTLKEYGKNLCELDLSVLIDSLTEQTKATNDGDLKRGEEMLTAQAHTLDAIFNSLALRASINIGEYMQACDTYLKLALRAQSQCRATWETLATIKNPPLVGYVRQANIAHGPQQVNNVSSTEDQPAPARENQNLQNKLLEEKDGERLDTRATGTAGRTNPEMAALGEVDRTEDTNR